MHIFRGCLGLGLDQEAPAEGKAQCRRPDRKFRGKSSTPHATHASTDGSGVKLHGELRVSSVRRPFVISADANSKAMSRTSPLPTIDQQVATQAPNVHGQAYVHVTQPKQQDSELLIDGKASDLPPGHDNCSDLSKPQHTHQQEEVANRRAQQPACAKQATLATTDKVPAMQQAQGPERRRDNAASAQAHGQARDGAAPAQAEACKGEQTGHALCQVAERASAATAPLVVDAMATPTARQYELSLLTQEAHGEMFVKVVGRLLGAESKGTERSEAKVGPVDTAPQIKLVAAVGVSIQEEAGVQDDTLLPEGQKLRQEQEQRRQIHAQQQQEEQADQHQEQAQEQQQQQEQVQHQVRAQAQQQEQEQHQEQAQEQRHNSQSVQGLSGESESEPAPGGHEAQQGASASVGGSPPPDTPEPSERPLHFNADVQLPLLPPSATSQCSGLVDRSCRLRRRLGHNSRGLGGGWGLLLLQACVGLACVVTFPRRRGTQQRRQRCNRQQQQQQQRGLQQRRPGGNTQQSTQQLRQERRQPATKDGSGLGLAFKEAVRRECESNWCKLIRPLSSQR